MPFSSGSPVATHIPFFVLPLLRTEYLGRVCLSLFFVLSSCNVFDGSVHARAIERTVLAASELSLPRSSAPKHTNRITTSCPTDPFDCLCSCTMIKAQTNVQIHAAMQVATGNGLCRTLYICTPAHRVVPHTVAFSAEKTLIPNCPVYIVLLNLDLYFLLRKQQAPSSAQRPLLQLTFVTTARCLCFCRRLLFFSFGEVVWSRLASRQAGSSLHGAP